MATGFFTQLERKGCAACGGYVESWTEQAPDAGAITVHPDEHLGACTPLEPGAREYAQAFEAEREAAAKAAAAAQAKPA